MTKWSDPNVIISLVQLAFTILIGVAAWIAVRLYARPTVRLAIRPRRIPSNNKAVILELEIENLSKVEIAKNKALIKVSRESLGSSSVKSGDLLTNEWVDFAHGAEEVFTSTEQVLPGERIHIERIYALEPTDILRVGLQFYGHSHKLWGGPLRWTTACFVAPEIDS